MSKLLGYLKRAAEYFWVKRCVACDELLEYDFEGYLCPKCASEWEEAKGELCPVCQKRACRCTCGNRNKLSVDRVRHLALYEPYEREYIVNRIVYALKKSNDDRVFDFVAREMAKEFSIKGGNLQNHILVSVPRNPSSVRRYGYDHAMKLAKRLAELTGIEYVDAMGHRGGKMEQKQLNRLQRLENAKRNCYIKDGSAEKLKGRHVMLVDDIITTGAMTGACAQLLRENGVLSVCCILAAKNDSGS